MADRTPYQDTAVSVERSKEQIRKALRGAGAIGVQFEEVWDPPSCRVRFIWPVEREDGVVIAQHVVRLEVTPLKPIHGARSAWRVSPEQRERQAWRGLAHYLAATLAAAEFGLIRFEDVFLSFIETKDGTTVGEALRPRLEAGPLQLTAGKS